MNRNKRSAKIIGLLYLAGFAAGILSIAYAVDDPDYLMKVSFRADSVIIAALFNFLLAPVYIFITIFLYPVLKRYNSSLAIGYFSFRFIASAFVIAGVLLLLLFLPLSREYINAGSPGGSYFQTLGILMQTGRDLVNHVAIIICLCISCLILNYILFTNRIIPVWLSCWGIAGAIMSSAASILFIFRFITIVTPEYLALNIPMALQELIFALWLIFRGFNTDGDI